MTSHPHPTPHPGPGAGSHAIDVTQTDTTDPEDIRALAVAVVDLVVASPAYDDMTWGEVSAAFALALAQIKVNWTQTGSVKPFPT